MTVAFAPARLVTDGSFAGLQPYADGNEGRSHGTGVSDRERQQVLDQLGPPPHHRYRHRPQARLSCQLAHRLGTERARPPGTSSTRSPVWETLPLPAPTGVCAASRPSGRPPPTTPRTAWRGSRWMNGRPRGPRLPPSDGNALYYINALAHPVTVTTPHAYATSPDCQGDEWRGGGRPMRV